MREKIGTLNLVFVVLFVFGVTGMALADNAAQVDVKISYPYGQTSAVSRVTGGDIVNVYITLLDVNGDPATAGPQGEMLWDVTATISSNLGMPDSITPYQFASDSADITFDSPSGTGPVARAHVDYTGANPGTDIITVVVAADPDPIVDTAGVNVSAPAADGLVVRTYRVVDPPSMIYTDMFVDPYWQSDNFGANELAGASVGFTVVAVSGDLYTYAPELEGQQVTVTAYADYSADNNDIGTAPQEMVPLANTATATFVNGIAEGTIRIDKAGPAGLDVVLTAAIEDSLETTQPPVDDASFVLNDGVDDDVDYVTMQSPSIPTGIIIGNDLFGNGNYLVEADCIQVPDDGTTGPTLVPAPAILVDSRGNAVVSSGGHTVVASLDPALDLLLTDGTGTGNPLTGSTAWDIAHGDYMSDGVNDSLEVIAGADNANALVSGGLTLTSGLLSDGAQAELLLTDGAGGIDFTVTDDTGILAIDAGDEVTLTLSAIVVAGDSIEITAVAGGKVQLLSLADQDFGDATTTLAIGSVSDADDPPAGDIDVKIRIYGPATTAIEPVYITVTVTSKCDIAAFTTVFDVEPLQEVFLNVVSVDSDPENAVDLNADPVVVTKQFVADNTFQDLIDPGDLQTLDAFGNVVDPSPDITATSQWGVPNVIGGDALELTYPMAAAGQADTVDVTTVGSLLRRNFYINNIVPYASSAADDLLVLQEGPQDQNGAQINPTTGGEAIVRISANGFGTSNRVVQISFGPGSIPGAELRTLNGVQLPLPFFLTLPFVPSLEDQRLVVSAPENGCVIINATDQSSTPLNPGSLTLCFSPYNVSCGNDAIEGEEVCDGLNLGGETCETQGYNGGGTLSCLYDCTGYDMSGCISGDLDDDGVTDDIDNCPDAPNGPDNGTCIWGDNVGGLCTLAGFNPMQCGDSGYCSMSQEDLFPPDGNGIGDACDCECDFDCDRDVDADDVETFLTDFGRFEFNNPCVNENQCNGDFSCDGDVDAVDVEKFLEDFGRFQFNNPCPACVAGDWCSY